MARDKRVRVANKTNIKLVIRLESRDGRPLSREEEVWPGKCLVFPDLEFANEGAVVVSIVYYK